MSTAGGWGGGGGGGGFGGGGGLSSPLKLDPNFHPSEDNRCPPAFDETQSDAPR